jgi:hypothetical protein
MLLKGRKISFLITKLQEKINFFKRIIKEKSTYEKEVTQTEDRIAKMKSDGKDEYDIKKMVINLRIKLEKPELLI